MALFELKKFISHSGIPLDWKIDCDALTDEDLECLAAVGRYLVGEFGRVVPVPTGGNRFAAAMEHWVTDGSPRTLIVDDVLTRGKSLDATRNALLDQLKEERSAAKTWSGQKIVGLVIFARAGGAHVPIWARAIFTLANPL